jgi:hypothetical protein
MRQRQEEKNVTASSKRCHSRWKDSKVVSQNREPRECDSEDVRNTALEDVLTHVSMLRCTRGMTHLIEWDFRRFIGTSIMISTDPIIRCTPCAPFSVVAPIVVRTHTRYHGTCDSRCLVVVSFGQAWAVQSDGLV